MSKHHQIIGGGESDLGKHVTSETSGVSRKLRVSCGNWQPALLGKLCEIGHGGFVVEIEAGDHSLEQDRALRALGNPHDGPSAAISVTELFEPAGQEQPFRHALEPGFVRNVLHACECARVANGGKQI